MGLFALPENRTREGYAEAAYYNLKLWNETKDNDYLLLLAKTYLDNALKENPR
jgi:hypothetical protein